MFPILSMSTGEKLGKGILYHHQLGVHYQEMLFYIYPLEHCYIHGTVEPRFCDNGKGQQNHIVKSGYHCKRTPVL